MLALIDTKMQELSDLIAQDTSSNSAEIVRLLKVELGPDRSTAITRDVVHLRGLFSAWVRELDDVVIFLCEHMSCLRNVEYRQLSLSDFLKRSRWIKHDN